MPALTSVPRFEPFVGLRYDTSQVDLDEVVAPPYDVLSDGEREELADRHPANIVRVDVPPESDGRAGTTGGAHAPAVAGRGHHAV